MAPSALILIADGTEEMEFVITYDVLVRAGVKCVSAKVYPGPAPSVGSSLSVTCSRGVQIVADVDLTCIESPSDFDAIVIPGGAKGSETCSQSEFVQRLVRTYHTNGKLVGMICAGALVALTAALPRSKITSHPSVKPQLENDFDYLEDSVVVADNLITSRGPGTSFHFALDLVQRLCGDEVREKVSGPMVFPAGTFKC